MVLNIDAKFEGKLTCAFKNELWNLTNFHRLKNSNLILESKLAELNKNKIQNNEIDHMQCEKLKNK